MFDHPFSMTGNHGFRYKTTQNASVTKKGNVTIVV